MNEQPADAMESAKRFFTRYLRQRDRMAKEQLREFRSFSRRFYAEECVLRTRRIAMLTRGSQDKEEVNSMSNCVGGMYVFTTVVGPDGIRVRTRYRLKSLPGGWLIQNIDSECPSCLGSAGDDLCTICGGAGFYPLLREKPKANTLFQESPDRSTPPPFSRRPPQRGNRIE
jgi:hypothetical protein